MILTVTLNAALDVTYQTPDLRPGTTHRVSSMDVRAGGKGVNVARVLHALGEPVVATGLVGGATGDTIRTLLDDVPHSFVDIGAESRRTTVVTDGATATGFWEPGAQVTLDEWHTFVAHYRAMLPASRVAVLSGSLPPGVPMDAYATLITAARASGVPTVLDTSGEAFRLGLAAGPDAVKPNAYELAEATGLAAGTAPDDQDLTVDQAYAAATALRGVGPTAVIASLGPRGLLACTVDGSWHAQPARPLPGNPTGAGDAAAAALAYGLAHRLPWPAMLAHAVGLSGAAVLAHVAGAVDIHDYQQQHKGAIVKEIGV